MASTACLPLKAPLHCHKNSWWWLWCLPSDLSEALVSTFWTIQRFCKMMSGTSLPFKAPTSHKILIKLFRSTVGTLASFIALVQTHFSWQGLTIKDCWACMRCCIKVSEELPVSKLFFYLITSYEHFTSACSKILKSFFKALLVVSH